VGYGCDVEDEVRLLSFLFFTSGFDRAASVHRPVLDVHVKDVMGGEGVAEPRLCADVILFLASDLSRGVNGAIIPVDQGWSVI
jgi:NAD(P)-dependent dehydrogenase (short-subunit alcohol dehydrogenase family)